MKWVGCLNQNLKHDTSQTPTESPTANSAIMRPSIYQVGVASLQPLKALKGVETHYICMKWTCCEYDVVGVPQS